MRRTSPLVLGLLAVSSPAWAQHSKRADVLFHEARRLAVAGDYAHACPKFEESERLDPAPGTLLNLADCEERVGHLVAASEHYRLAASGFPQRDKRRLYCTKKADALDARVGHLTLQLAPDAPDGTTVRENDEVVAPSDLGHAALVDPGTLTVVVSAEGRADKTYPVVVQEGGSVTLTVEPGPPLAAPKTIVVVKTAPEAPPAPRRSSPLGPIGVAVGGVGVVALGVGIVTGVMAIDRANTVKAHCNTTTDVCDDIGLAAAHDGAILSPLSTVLVIGGGVLAATGAVLFVVGRTSHTTVRAAFVPGGLTVSGTFW